MKKDLAIAIGPIGSRGGYTIFFRNKDDKISVQCGCFLGTIEEFEQRVIEIHGDNQHARDYKLAIEMAKKQIKLN